MRTKASRIAFSFASLRLYKPQGRYYDNARLLSFPIACITWTWFTLYDYFFDNALPSVTMLARRSSRIAYYRA